MINVHGIRHHVSGLLGETPMDSAEFPEMVKAHATNIVSLSAYRLICSMTSRFFSWLQETCRER